MPSFRMCEQWTDRALAEIAREQGMRMSNESLDGAKVYTAGTWAERLAEIKRQAREEFA